MVFLSILRRYGSAAALLSVVACESEPEIAPKPARGAQESPRASAQPALGSALSGSDTSFADCRHARVEVPALPPSAAPGWMYDSAQIVTKSPYIPAPFVRGVLLVMFRSEASQEMRQEALQRVCGEVVGGDPGSFIYFVRVPGDSIGERITAASRILQQLPQVETVVPNIVGGIDFEMLQDDPNTLPLFPPAPGKVSHPLPPLDSANEAGGE